MEATTAKGKRTKRQRGSQQRNHIYSGESSSSSEYTDGTVNYNGGVTEEEQDMANCLILLATSTKKNDVVCSYECKTCDRAFPSFQALGGHRASHKKKKSVPFRLVDGSLSIRVSPGRGILGILNPRVHECSICGAEFTSGQALGGHMRRHRPTATSSSLLPNQATITTTSFSSYSSEDHQKKVLELDLNLPAPETTNFPFSDQVIVFSATPLVDCHY